MIYPPNKRALTPREAAVLGYLRLGLKNREIGERLGIAEKSVKGHVTQVLRKLGVRNRTQAALQAYRSGEVPI